MSEAYIRRRKAAGGFVFGQSVTVEDSFQISALEPDIQTGNYIITSGTAEDIITFAFDSEVLAQENIFVSAEAVDIINITTQEQTTVRREVTATFDSNGGSAVPSQTGLSPLSVQEPTQPGRVGYNFVRWRIFGQPVTFPFTIFEDRTFIAEWQPIVYTITYVMNQGTNNPGNPNTFTIEDLPITLLNPSRNLHEFEGWTPDVTIVSTGNTTRTANWSFPPVATPTAQFSSSTQNSITFSIRNNETRQSGFINMNWQIIGPLPNQTQRASGQVQGAVPGQFYNASASSLSADQSYGVLVQAFDGLNQLNADGSSETSASGLTQPLPKTLKPEFESISSTTSSISFRIRNKEQAQVTIRYRLGANPNASSPSFNLSSGALSSTLTFSGLAAGTTYSVRADALRTDGTKLRSDVEPVTITTQAATPLPAPTFNAGSPFASSATGVGMILTNNNNGNVANVTTQVSINSGSWINVATFSDFRNNISYNFAATPSTSYIIQIRNTTTTAGFSTSGTSTSGVTTPAAPTVTAMFDSAGGSPTYGSQSGTAPLSVFNPGSPSKSGFTFLGWSPSVPTTINSNTTFTAQWQDDTPPTITATFDSNGGSPTYSSQSGQSPLSVSNPGSPTRSGFNFLGWSPSVPTTITSDTTFTAQWEEVAQPTTYTTTARVARATGSWFLSVSITYRGSSRTINTSSITTLDSSIADGTSVTLTAPLSVTSSGLTYTFVRWRVNGVNQSLGTRTITRTINANTFFEPIYEQGGLG